MIGALHAAGAGSAADWNLKRRRIEYDASQGGQSINQLMQINRNLASATEYGAARRASASFYRLHAAKFLKCDPLLKALFFPSLNAKWQFGFCSVSAIQRNVDNTPTTTSGIIATQKVAGQSDVPSNPSNGTNGADLTSWTKPRGSYRGFASFTIRTSRIDESSDMDSNKLNTMPIVVGQSNVFGRTSTGYPLMSAYRRFFNGPTLKKATTGVTGSGELVDLDNCPAVSSTLKWSNTDENGTSKTAIYCGEVGNRQLLEQTAANACPFVPSNSLKYGPSVDAPLGTGVAGQTAPGQFSSTNPPYQLTTANNSYYSSVANTPFRICDGYLELDISNGKVAPVLIEIVLHSFKKHATTSGERLNTLYRAIWNSVQKSQRQRMDGYNYDNQSGESIYQNQNTGGWQAFYDPKYPFLKTKGGADKAQLDAIAPEVHRSMHVLAPGQFKTVRISLGSLYYSLGNQSKLDLTNTDATYPLQASTVAVPPGSLLCSIGHSGFEMLSAANIGFESISASTTSNFQTIYPDYLDSNHNHVVPGTGFWVGKQNTASEIVVSGNYCEKFYPIFPGLGEHEKTYATTTIPPPFVKDAYSKFGLPAAMPATDVQATTSANTAYPANNTTESREPLSMEL